MEAYAVIQFFTILSEALVDGSKSFHFSDKMQEQLNSIQKKDAADQHDISNILYRLKQNVLGLPDPYDGKVRNTPEVLIPFVCQLLEERWAVIKDTARDYTRCSTKLNEPYIALVRLLHEFSLAALSGDEKLGRKGNANLGAILNKWMRPIAVGEDGKEPNFHALLIPTLTQSIEPVSREIITKFNLNNFVLSEDETSLILLKNSQKSFDQERGFLNIDVPENKHGIVPVRFFTAREKQRIKNKPHALQPDVITKEFTDDYILTLDYRGPALERNTKEQISAFVSRANNIAFDPHSSFEAYKKKYHIEKRSLEKQDIEYLWQLHAAEIRTDDRMACNQAVQAKLRIGSSAQETKEQRIKRETQEELLRDDKVGRLEKTFKDNLDKSGPSQTERTLRFLATKARQTKIANIAAEMLVYYKTLKKEHFCEYNRLKNQVFYEPGSKPKTFALLMERLAGSINLPESIGGGMACADATFFELKELLEHVTLRKRINSDAVAVESPSKRSTTPLTLPADASQSKVHVPGFWSFFSSSDQSYSEQKQQKEPVSVSDASAYSPPG